ncbi:MAG: hypothetical protein CBC56_001745 [Flavobacteriales bacterium TMED96]|nr:MAG: hypothetical protein CBC56_001745 [Flavobacteriales bacterium TMED96]
MFDNSNKYLQFIGGFLALGFTLLQGIDWVFRKFEIDSFYFNLILIILFIFLLASIISFLVKANKEKLSGRGPRKRSIFKLILNISLTVILIFVFLFFFRKINSTQKLLDEELPKIIELYDKGKIFDVYILTQSLHKLNPNNEIINNYFKKSRRYVKVKTNVDSVKVSIKIIGDSLFRQIGFTPIDSFAVPRVRNSYLLKLEHNGVNYIEKATFNHKYNLPVKKFKFPQNHKAFLGKNFNRMWLQGVQFDDIKIEPFTISKFEVSNKEYQEFLDDGGYLNPKFWDFPITIDKRSYDFKSSMKLFTGKYGKSGPANWSYGKFPNGLENHPVTGISWFEAKAYAKYRNLDIPNVFQWLYASGTGFSGIYDSRVIDNSNFNSNQMREVTDARGSANGVNNIAGNVKEWLHNPFGNKRDEYSILGGSYQEPSYYVKNYASLPPMDRSIGNGIRLVKNLTKNRKDRNKTLVIPDFYRDITIEPDVSDEVFELFKSQFEYKKKELNVSTQIANNFKEGYTLETFSMKTTYESRESLFGYIIYSNSYDDRYNPVIIVPSARAILNKTVDELPETILSQFKYLIDEGYAIFHPIYYNTYSRERAIDTWLPNESEEYKEMIIKWGQDYKRSLDYLQTRKDFKFENLSYYGYSLGSRYANIFLAIDKRVKSAFLVVGGLRMQKSKKEIDEHYYLRRVQTPIFHIVGKLDATLGYEDVYLPWKKLVGTDLKDLRTLELDGFGHGIPKDTIVKYHKSWIEKYSVE